MFTWTESDENLLQDETLFLKEKENENLNHNKDKIKNNEKIPDLMQMNQNNTFPESKNTIYKEILDILRKGQEMDEKVASDGYKKEQSEEFQKHFNSDGLLGTSSDNDGRKSGTSELKTERKRVNFRDLPENLKINQRNTENLKENNQKNEINIDLDNIFLEDSDGLVDQFENIKNSQKDQKYLKLLYEYFEKDKAEDEKMIKRLKDVLRKM